MRNYLKYIICLNILLAQSKICAQFKNQDSLLKVIKGMDLARIVGLGDTNKVRTLHLIARNYFDVGEIDSSMKIAAIEIELGEKMMRMPESKYTIVKKNMSNAYSVMGLIYRNYGNYPKALSCQYKALKLREEINHKKGMASSHLDIGNIFSNQNEMQKAISEYSKCYEISKALGDKRNMGVALNNLGIVYLRQKEYKSALSRYLAAEKLFTEINDVNGEAMAFSNIGEAYSRIDSNNIRALEYLQKALVICKKSGNKRSAAIAYITIGAARLKEISKLKHKNEREIIACTEPLFAALDILKVVKDPELLKNVYVELFNAYSLTSNHKKALDYYKLFIQNRDSLTNEENTKKNVQAQMNYQFDKKEAAAKLEQEKKDAIALEEHQKQKIIRNSFIGGFCLMMVLAGFIFRSYRQKQRSNQIILTQKQEVEKQKALVEQKQTQIIGSINYAKRIQNSILTPEDEIKKYLPELFILYLPKDIVSGDFYWASEPDTREAPKLLTNSTELIIVAADCTGHGVPGAFLSMVGSTLLNEIVKHNKITDPANIIKELAKGVSATLTNKEKDEENTDGMDISVCKVNPQKKEVLFAGANHTLYVVNSKGLQKIESQIDSINGIFGLNNNENIHSISLNLEKGTMVYMSTDGYADQTGGENLKKYLTSRLENKLSEIYDLPTNEQKQKLQNNFNEWKGKTKQVDDVLVIGFRV